MTLHTTVNGGRLLVDCLIAQGADRIFTVPGESFLAVLDALQLVDISNNIGDARSLMCHPASSTHANMGDEARAAMGVTEGLLRINVGLEDIADLIEDMDQALAAAGI